MFEQEEKDLRSQLKSANEIEHIEENNEVILQGSKNWFKMRLGLLTGSKWPSIMTKGRGSEYGDTFYKMLNTIYVERDLSDDGIDLYVEEQYNTEFRQTKWGNKYEQFAREAYEQITGDTVKTTTFKVGKLITWIAGSFDGEVESKNKIIEIKCPYDVTVHVKNCELEKTGITEKHTYYAQIQCNIFVAGVDSCDFVSYDPRRKTNKIVIINVPKDDAFIEKMIIRGTILDSACDLMLNDGLTAEEAILLADNYYKNGKI